MCYDVKALLKAQLKRYKGTGVAEKEIRDKIAELGGVDFYHAAGFAHPKLFIYKTSSPSLPVAASWGLVPHWVKDEVQMLNIRNNTINARGETIFDKPAFRDAAETSRCLIQINGFFEHHHYGGKSYPYYIYPKHNEALTLGGLCAEWTNQSTGEVVESFTIVTTRGNQLLSKIHNNPKQLEPRMPLILDEYAAEEWLKPIGNITDRHNIKQLIKPYSKPELEAYTVNRLRGRGVDLNSPSTSNKCIYPELECKLF